MTLVQLIVHQLKISNIYYNIKLRIILEWADH
jgi:hypothetical protein